MHSIVLLDSKITVVENNTQSLILGKKTRDYH